MRGKRTLALTSLGLVAALALHHFLGATAQGPEGPTGTRRALLVAATRYDNLSDSWHLKGPDNSIRLARQMLIDRFGFLPADIKMLIEDSPHRATRANIEAAFRELKEVSKPGDQVFILIAGHGSQQPDQDPPQEDDPEPDGLDEIYLPADVGPWDGSKIAVSKAITDDDFRAWTRAITDRGVSVFAAFDCCHSGTLLRASDEEQAMEIRPDTPKVFRNSADSLVPPAALEAARARAKKQPPAKAETSAVWKVPEGTHVVALYAALSTEPTFTRPMPPVAEKREQHCLFTYTLCEVLSAAREPITYRELLQQIQARYSAWGRVSPTPLAEGSDLDREVLGKRSWKDRSKIILSGSADDGYTVNAGQLLGLSKGAVVAVYPPPGQAADKIVGHVRVSQSSIHLSNVTPCAHGKHPVVDKLPAGGRCEIVEFDAGLERTKIAADPKADPKDLALLKKMLDAVTARRESMTVAASDAATAEWLLRADKEGVVLQQTDASRSTPRVFPLATFGPFAADDAADVAQSFASIGRAANLLRLAGGHRAHVDPAAPRLGIEVLRIPAGSKTGLEAVGKGKTTLELRSGDAVKLRVTNLGKESADVTILMMDANFGIANLFPESGVTLDNRLGPGGRVTTGRIEIVKTESPALYHAIVLGVTSREQPISFSWLAQSSLASAVAQRSENRRASTMERLFENALFAKGEATRTASREAVADHSIGMFTWRVVP